jgi:hypothetical protein
VNPRIRNIHKLIPGIFGEITGVLHSKLLVFDNHTILTGANLSHSYFTNRQDRYFVIQDCEPFADYCEDYIKSCNYIVYYLLIVSNVAYTTDNEGEISPQANFPNPYNKKVEYINAILQQFKMFKYDNRVKIPVGEELKMEDYFENLEKYNSNYKTRPSSVNLIEFNQERNEFLKHLIEENKGTDLSFIKKYNKPKEEPKKETESDIGSRGSVIKESKSNKVLIFPSVILFIIIYPN